MANPNFITTLVICYLCVSLITLPISAISNDYHDLDDSEYTSPGQKSYFHEIASLAKEKQITPHDFSSSDELQDIFLKVSNVFNFVNNLKRNKSPAGIPNDDTSAFLSAFETVADEEIEKYGNISTCINDTGRIIENLFSPIEQPWVLQFIDAMGKPGPSVLQARWRFVGNYYQCRAAKSNHTQNVQDFSGNYCAMGFKVVSGGVKPIVFPVPVEMGLCMPDTCSQQQLKSLFSSLLQVAGINNTFVTAVECRTAPTKATTATVMAIIILSLVGILALFGTIWDVLFVQKLFEDKSTTEYVKLEGKDAEANGNGHTLASNSDSKPYQNGSAASANSHVINTESEHLLPKQKTEKTTNNNNTNNSVLVKILLAFSIYTNAKKLLNTKQPPGALTSIHGIRFLSMSWVVLGHFFLFFGSGYAINIAKETQRLTNRWTFQAISNALVSVDSFFTLSGLLTAYLAIQEIQRRGGPLRINWGLYYFHRFWRLTPPYMFAMVIALGLQQYMGRGAMWANTQPTDKTFCEDNWWTNLLYINNLVKPNKMCFGHSWYLANDMQFFILSPLFLIPFFYHRFAGLASCGYVMIISWITTGVLSYINDWGIGIGSIADQPQWFKEYYIVPWCRIGPYLVGIVAGYILAQHKGRPFRMPKWFVVLGWVIATATALGVLYGPYGDATKKYPATRLDKAFYNAVGRTLWGACVSWVIVACSAGYGGPVNAILSWSPFVTLGRLTYMTYLIHICCLAVLGGNMETLWYLNDTTAPIMYLGILFFVNMVSFAFVCLLESPMIGLEKILLRKDGKKE